MKRRGSGETPSVRTFIGWVYKSLAIRTSELMARLLGVSNESFSIVVYEIVREKGVVI